MSANALPVPPEFDTNRHNYLISLETVSKFPLQQAQLGIRNGLSDVHRRQQVSLLTVNVGDACDRHPLVNGNALALNPSQLRQGALG